MLRKILLPTIFLLLGYGFTQSDEFKTVTAGVAIFLFGMLSLEEGFKTFTGGTLEKVLKKSTDRLWKSMTFGVITIAILGIYQLMQAVGWISAHLGIAGDNYTLQLAVFHTMFNLIGIIVMLPLLKLLVKFLEKLFLDDEIKVELPRYLSKASMEMADAAVEAARKETTRLYDLTVGVINDGLSIQRDASSPTKRSSGL